MDCDGLARMAPFHSPDDDVRKMAPVTAAWCVCVLNLLVFLVSVRRNYCVNSVYSGYTRQLHREYNSCREIYGLTRIPGLNQFILSGSVGCYGKLRGRKRRLSAPILKYNTFLLDFQAGL